MSAGFIKLRRGLLEHLPEMPANACKLYLWFHLQARFQGTETGTVSAYVSAICSGTGMARHTAVEALRFLTTSPRGPYLEVVHVGSNQHSGTVYRILKWDPGSTGEEGGRKSTGEEQTTLKSEGQRRRNAGRAGAEIAPAETGLPVQKLHQRNPVASAETAPAENARRCKNCTSSVQKLHRQCAKTAPADHVKPSGISELQAPKNVKNEEECITRRTKKSPREKSSDPRFAKVVKFYLEGYRQRFPDRPAPTWGKADGEQLNRLLRANPEQPVEYFERLIAARLDSEDAGRTDAFHRWASRLARWADGPTDQYGQPLQPKAPPVARSGLTDPLETLRRQGVMV